MEDRYLEKAAEEWNDLRESLKTVRPIEKRLRIEFDGYPLPWTVTDIIRVDLEDRHLAVLDSAGFWQFFENVNRIEIEPVTDAHFGSLSE
jgi:hypothetical protein